MDFVPMDDFLPDLLPEVAGCSNFTVIDRLRWAAIEFCKRTGVSTETTAEIDLDAGESLIGIPSPSNSVIPWQVLWVKTTLGPVESADRRLLNEHGNQWEGRVGGRPIAYVRPNNREIQLIPTPEINKAAELTMHCSYIPAADADELDRVLFDEYREALVSGALSRLLSMSNQAWYDPAEARERRDLFAIAISSARALADKDFVVGEQRVQMMPFA